ncbi:MAG TPA: CDP-alcohol phosphatidyltransferase family protein [Gemmatimonadales bacterium]|jgi:phosphatidylglycerophosphate synthase
MTVRARLTAPAAGDPWLRIAGMTVLLRQLLSLQDAGVDEVEIEGVPAERLPRDPRLHLTPYPLSATAERGTGGEVTARLGLVWHRLFPRRLVQTGYHGDLEAAPLEPNEFIIPADSEANCRRATDLLLTSLLKATDGLIARSINRPLSLRLTRALLDTSLTPNQMTLIAAVFGLAGIAVVAVGGARWLVPGALLLQVQSILDGCDGEISRLKYIRSRLGEWLDQVLDDVVNVGFFAAAGWALHRAGSPIALPLTVVGTALHLIYQAALYAGLLTRGGGSGSVTSIRWWGQRDSARPAPAAPPGALTSFKETVESAGRRDFFTFLYLPAALLNLTEIALAWSAIIFVVSGVATGLQWALRGGPEPATRTS